MTQQELNTIIQTGEGYKIEFKRSVNSDLSKEIVAFANSSGGRIFIGIDDIGSVSGITVDNSLKSKIEMMARDCDPSISVSVEVSNNVLILHVPEGTNKPYRCTNGFYIRNGACSLKLSTEEIRDFFVAEGKVHFDEMPSKLKYPDAVDKNLVSRYLQLSGISKTIDPQQLLFNLGVLDKQSAGYLNHSGLLFFYQNPAIYIPQSSVTCVVYKGTIKVDIIDKKTFELDLIGNIDEAMAFLKRHLNLSYEIKTKRRIEKLEIPEVVLREAVVNAVTHRDYFEKGATVMVEVFDDRVEISNPGGLPKGLKEEDFGKRTLARNPLIASLLQRAGYIEKLGTGVARMKEGMLDEHLPEPEFAFNNFFVITLKRAGVPVKKTGLLELNVTGAKGERIRYILEALKAGKKPDVAVIAKRFSMNESTIRKDLLWLEKNGWLIGKGSTRDRFYELSEMAVTSMNQ
jgi:ATP-dependent DNA helicase RecG